MTTRNLFLIIIKVFGLYFIRELFILTAQLLPAVYYFKAGQNVEALWTMISTIIIFALELLIIYYLLFKTEWIINKLKLTSGFDQETIPFNMHRSTVIQIAVIIIGGLLLVDEIPNFCRRAFNYFQERRMNYSEYSKEIPYIVVSLVKIVLAFLILAEQRKIVSLIVRRTNPAIDPEISGPGKTPSR